MAIRHALLMFRTNARCLRTEYRSHSRLLSQPQQTHKF